ncbi:RREB1 [Acanthosepion pharaonis]|uniref:RREB1 n=1 Tax=Acanthosepion pharaonis TaxID=158019 RepID=A0A812DA21_ACAPH|nr:RREB1 [Sepia pharaonis]
MTIPDTGEIHKKTPQNTFSEHMILPTGKDGQNGYVCPQCDTLVPTQHELTTHLRSHNGVNNSRSEHQCHQCWKILSSSSSLDRHMLTHSGEKPFSCRICKQSFTTNGNMHRHMRTHEKKNDQRRAALLKPKNKSSSSSSKMDLFNDSMIDVSASKNSLRLSENVEMVSQSVLKTTWSSSTLTDANKKPTSDSQGDLNPKPSIPPYQNEGHDLSQKTVLKNTLSSLPHSPTESSPKHSLHSSPRSSPLNSITTVEFSSSKFPLICIAEGSKNVHRPKTGQQEYGCEDCQLYFPCKKALDLHLQTHCTDKRTSCSVCDLTFSSPENYQQHCHCYHTEDTNEYQAVFMNSLNLVSNQNTSKMAELQSCVNGIDKGSLAKQCHLSKDTQPGSVSPQLQIDKYCEEDIKPKEGQLNNYSIPQDESTNSHISIGAEKAFNGSAKKKSSYTCTYCNKDFINTRAAKSHERSHLGLSPYQCKSCSYSSPDKSTLIRHMRTHNGERPYQCKLCNYAFTTKANCERHVKKKHNIFKKEELETKVGYNKDTKEAQDDSFSSPDTVCKYCNKDFKYFRRLKHHLRGHRSSEEKPFKCKQCDMGFSTKANCVRHIQNKHTEINHINIENYVQMQESMFTSFMGHTGPPRCTSAPPPAHSPAVRFSDDSTEDAKPLDLRSSRNLSQSSSPSVNGGSLICPEEQDNNEPIDLSIKRTKKAIRKIVRTPDPNAQCPKCDQEFGSELERQYHIKISHDQATKPGDSESWQKQSASQHVSHAPGVSLHHNCQSPLTKKIKLEQNPQKDKIPNIDCNSDDLASVSQILNTTGANSFEAYFANHQEDDTLLLLGQTNGYSSSPSEYGNDGLQIKDEPRELDSEYISVTQEENILNNSSDAKDMARQEPEMDSVQKSHKKKRNSYADSPHKLKCPHCPRHFPWASSLNRHILTHTGEKPFECPKCHVIFSTKSNRERHLTRKHGVNMLDPAARQTMDRPFKCHLCTFSSFATKENLLRHYRDRHPEDPLPDGVCDGIEKTSSSGSSPQQQKNKFHSGSSNIRMDLKSPVSAEKSMSDEHALIPSKLTERENTFRDDVGPKNEELEINNNLLHWTQKPTDLQGNLTSKSHLCYMCGYKLSTQQLLQQHLEVHSKDLPFKCHLCDTSFHERSKCLKHMEKEHRAKWSILTNKNKITNMEQFSDDVGHRCQEYVKQLSDCVEQNSHMTDYLNRKVYCSFCTKRFWSTQDLCHHMHSHTVCQLTNKEAIIPSSVSETDPLLVRTRAADFSAKSKETETEDILPTMLGMDEASIDFLLDSAVAGVHLPSSYIP